MASSNNWERSGDKNSDQLNLYLTSEMYDCSFKVGFKESGYKIFKCHKLILSIASTVFQTMFYGHFQESKKGPDDPVTLENIKPEAFDVAMRYIYGSKKEFKDAAITVEVYKFAHEMQLENLVADAGKFLYDVGPDNLIPVYNLFTLTADENGLQSCRMKMVKNAASVLGSIFWLSATKETIQDILGLDDLGVSESDLFQAIMRWGIVQIKKEGKRECNASELRAVVDPCIKLIRFMSMECKEFAELCTTMNVLSFEEKYKILLSLTLNNTKFMPGNFDHSNIRRMLTCSAIICFTSYVHRAGISSSHNNLQISLNQTEPIDLLGVAIDLNPASNRLTGLTAEFKITISNISSGKALTEGSLSNIRRVNGFDIIFFSPPIAFVAGQTYVMKCSVPATQDYCYLIHNSQTSDLLHNATSKIQSPASFHHEFNQLLRRNHHQITLNLYGNYSPVPIQGFIFSSGGSSHLGPGDFDPCGPYPLHGKVGVVREAGGPLTMVKSPEARRIVRPVPPVPLVNPPPIFIPQKLKKKSFKFH